MTDELTTLLKDQSSKLLAANAPGIAEELEAAANGELSVSLGFKLCLIGRKIVCDSTVAYSRKFKDELEGVVELEDPNQPALPMEDATVTIKSGNNEPPW